MEQIKKYRRKKKRKLINDPVLWLRVGQIVTGTAIMFLLLYGMMFCLMAEALKRA